MSHKQEQETDQNASRIGLFPGNDYALPYFSEWSRQNNAHRDMLEHMNCSFFSTPGRPPTLASLKLHAQSLAYAICLLCPGNSNEKLVVRDASKSEEDSPPADKAKLEDNDRFDWLFDMRKPYETKDSTHFTSMNNLVNQIKSHHDVFGTKLHCPLTEHVVRAKYALRKPYASHHNLLLHANACLERLDHEYSQTGGLLSILPLDEDYDEKDMSAARNTLVGQWLMHTQRLTNRMHELEISYAQALDVLQGGAQETLQHLSAQGLEARTEGRVPAYPQDRWLLTNAGDDVFNLIHGQLDRKEKLAQHQAQLWREAGVAGERLWRDKDHTELDEEYERGFVFIDVKTRYYRQKGLGKSLIYITPVHSEHPNITATRDLENKPTVVTVPAPRSRHWASDMEKRYDAQLEQVGHWKKQVEKMHKELYEKDIELARWERRYGELQDQIGDDAVGKQRRQDQDSAEEEF